MSFRSSNINKVKEASSIFVQLEGFLKDHEDSRTHWLHFNLPREKCSDIKRPAAALYRQFHTSNSGYTSSIMNFITFHRDFSWQTGRVRNAVERSSKLGIPCPGPLIWTDIVLASGVAFLTFYKTTPGDPGNNFRISRSDEKASNAGASL